MGQDICRAPAGALQISLCSKKLSQDGGSAYISLEIECNFPVTTCTQCDSFFHPFTALFHSVSSEHYTAQTFYIPQEKKRWLWHFVIIPDLELFIKVRVPICT